MAFIKPREFGGKMMIIGKNKESSSSSLPRPPSYVKLSRRFDHLGKNDDDNDNNDDNRQGGTPKGHVPVMVGKEEGECKRFVVPTWFMKDPSMIELLQLSADEFGYNHQGVLQIPCEPHYFAKVIGKLSKKGARSLSL